MSYKVLVLDLDGTLTNSKKELTDRTKEVLLKAQDQGVKVVLASGRPTHGIVDLAEELKLPEYGGFILSFNGGDIINCATNQSIFQKTIPEDLISSLVNMAKKHKVDILSYEGDNIITNNPDNIYTQKEGFINKMDIVQVDDLSTHINFPVNKMMMLADGDYLAQVEKIVQEETKDLLSVYRSEVFFLEIMPMNIDKAQSLAKLLEYLELTPKDMMACGDGFNDLSMIEYAGLGVAMANAQPVVKEAADIITLSNDEDGVAVAVEQYIL